MRIVHFLHGRVNPNGTNGGDRVIYNLAKRTSDLGAEVVVVGLSEKPILPLGHCTVRHLPPPRGPFALAPALLEMLREIQPDIVHFHGVYTPRNAVLARWLRHNGIQYAISPHGGLMPGVLSRSGMKRAYLKTLARGYCRRASVIHCVSDAEADAVRGFLGDVPTVVASHGVEGIDLGSLDSGSLRKCHPQLGEKRVFGFLGRLDPVNKGLDLVVEACARIRPSLSNAVIILAGPDWKDRTVWLRRRVRELGLQEIVLFHGAIATGPDVIQEKFNFLASCDVFIHPSRWEAGIPFSVLDALEVAKPCLVTDSTFFGQLFRQNSVGKQVAPTEEGVAEGLRHLAEASDEDLAAMGAEARRAALREFSWERTAAKLLRAYEQACEGRTGTNSLVADGVGLN
jgi:glycosyltransferase involved in cell wall biosynthesis